MAQLQYSLEGHRAGSQTGGKTVANKELDKPTQYTRGKHVDCNSFILKLQTASILDMLRLGQTVGRELGPAQYFGQKLCQFTEVFQRKRS